MINDHESKYRWWVLGLAAITNTMVVAVQGMCLPVLFKEISADLQLNLVQVGMIWGISALPGIFSSLLGGAIGDRFGPKRILVLGCLLAGLAGALRGLAVDFYSLAGGMFLLGLLTPIISMNNFKTCGMWFSRKQFGLASGVLSMGMALGFLSSSMLSATFLSPWLGGWRNVLFLYGGIAVAFCIPWFLIQKPEAEHAIRAGTSGADNLVKNLAVVAKMRNIWLFGMTIFGISGGIQGLLGYLPLYLRGVGWSGPMADSASGAFHTVSLLCVIPIALLSDSLRTRKKILLVANTMISSGAALLSVASGGLVWVAVLLAGMVRDGFMAVFMTAIVETEGVGPALAGTATGMVMVFSGLGNMIAPPLGNSLAAGGANLPFLFWACLSLIGLVGLGLSREKIFRPAKAADLNDLG